MTALLYLLGVLIFVGAILVSIGLHELGHMIPAKRFGGKVTQYFIGFGPTVWSRQVGETEYGVKAIPLGGYVKIVGMLPPGADDPVDEVTYDDHGNRVQKIRKSNTGMFTQLISDARAAEWELVRPEDSDRLFYKMPSWKKIVVMAGGPTVNLLIAFFLFWGLFATHGIERDRVPAEGAPVVATISDCVLPAAESNRRCSSADPDTPAKAMGLEPGDRIVGFNGTTVTSWDQLRSLITGYRGGDTPVTIDVVRDGAPAEVSGPLVVSARPVEPGSTTTAEVPFLGVSPTQVSIVEKGGPLFTLGEMGHMTVDTVQAIGTLPVKVFGVAKAIVGIEDRAVDSPVSIVGGGRFAGEAASNDVATTSDKVFFLVALIAGFNLFIGMFNFVPLLPLDGGHIASALWEAIRRGIARLRRRPDPGYVDAAKLLPVAYVVGSVILVMGVVLIVGDLVVPVASPFG